MPERCTLDGFVITPIEPQGSLYAGTDHGRLFINEARTGVMAWWSMGRWTDRAAREAIIAHAMSMTLADFRRWFARHAASCLVDQRRMFCDGAVLSRHTPCAFHGGEPGHALHSGPYQKYKPCRPCVYRRGKLGWSPLRASAFGNGEGFPLQWLNL